MRFTAMLRADLYDPLILYDRVARRLRLC